jgi:predicted nucleotidyltransferase
VSIGPGRSLLDLGLPPRATYTLPYAMQRERIIETIRSHASELPRFDVQSLLLFGSVARDEAHEQSDVDLLVSFRGAATFGHTMGLKLFLEDLLGHRVDLVTERALRHELRERVEREAIHVA